MNRFRPSLGKSKSHSSCVLIFICPFRLSQGQRHSLRVNGEATTFVFQLEAHCQSNVRVHVVLCDISTW